MIVKLCRHREIGDRLTNNRLIRKIYEYFAFEFRIASRIDSNKAIGE